MIEGVNMFLKIGAVDFYERCIEDEVERIEVIVGSHKLFFSEPLYSKQSLDEIECILRKSTLFEENKQ